MPHDKPDVTVKGIILDVFAHRFVVETAEGKILADLGKHMLASHIQWLATIELWR